ncbi:SUR7/PalI family-domain-containing protein [Dactylonectria estremocensis]|uniref:SUR7/PalI family-domain-containing protein n=1 Tax=Dactylonectria estremocensis TaxID=1079267 RepID=A0A9P9FCK0_9HYPO|nr:SUR7/PalI family-domain-containing protein [Dactylonectria estremocensis]
MLRPATPLALMMGIAFALLLLAVLSVPIIEAIPLGDFNGITFGVFGYCQSGSGCTNIGIGYDTSDLFEDSSFDLPSGVRTTLSAILIVHPVAALLTLVLFIMAVIGHMHAPAHSSRYLLVVFIFIFIDFLVCLLAFLIDVLLFVPHLAWGSYIVLAATILVALSGLITCAMRRTLIGRKDRQKRIAENAEMSGENYYNRTGQTKPPEEVARQPTIPSVSGANGETTDNLPGFATYDQQAKNDQLSDENIPLTRRTTSNRSPIPVNDAASVGEVAAFNNSPRRQGSRDQYGNPINDPQDGYGVRRGPSTERMRGRDLGPQGSYRGGRGGYGRDYGAPPMRGRGYGSQNRGGYGPPRGRGGYGPPPRGAYGPGGMRGARSPPPGYNGPYDRRPSPAEAYVAYDQQPSEPSNGYNSANPSMPSVNAAYNSYATVSTVSSLPRAESPPPLPGTEPATIGGQAIEMDANPAGQRDKTYIRESDSDVAGMINLQQGMMPPNRHDTYMTESSRYSGDEQYAPPRAGWNQSGRSSPRAPSPLVLGRPIAELPVGHTSPTPQTNIAGNYYEDVDPRFASNTPPGTGTNLPPPIEPIYEDIHVNNPGTRSPAESTFTSISQRGVNPRWNPSPNPPPPVPYQQGPPTRRPVNQQQQRQDMILDNPDFQLPGARSKGGGMVPGSAYPPGSM